MPRSLPPVSSPLSALALISGVRASVRSRAASEARELLRVALRARGFGAPTLFADSGTSALALALQLAHQKNGQPVALPAFACYDIATAADAAKVPVLLYDVSPRTLAPDLQSVEAAVALGARTFVAVHLYGLPVDIISLRALLPSDSFVIDDAAQGIGAHLAGQPLGSHGDLGVLSFGRGKGLTGGGGGALLLNRELGTEAVELEPLLSLRPGNLRTLAATVAQWVFARPRVYALPRALPFLSLGETLYHPPHAPAGISAFSLGVLSQTVRTVDGEQTRRQRAARYYREHLGPLAGLSGSFG